MSYKLRDFMPADPEGERLHRLIEEMDAEERRAEERRNRLKALSLVGVASLLAPGLASQLLPAPKRFDCPRCGRAKLQRGSGLTYCLRCAYTVKP